MTALNQQMLDQNNQIKNITKIANETNDIQNNILGTLYGQGEKI